MSGTGPTSKISLKTDEEETDETKQRIISNSNYVAPKSSVTPLSRHLIRSSDRQVKHSKGSNGPPEFKSFLAEIF